MGSAPPQRPALAVQFGPLKLTGPAAILTLVLLFGAVTALIVWMHPALHMLVSGAVWLVFFIYWAVAATKAAPTKSAESSASRAVHTRLLYGSMLLLFAPVPGLRLRFLPLTNVVVGTGLAIQLLSLALALWARRHLGRNWGAALRVAVGQELVRSGPYRKVRHPIYTAMMGLYAGTALVSGELRALLAFVIVVAAYARKISLEERTLGEFFGPDYQTYRRDTWALLPGLF